MLNEELIKNVLKDYDKDVIINQYWYDYNQIWKYAKIIQDEHEEIERLNNIINELESYLEQQWLEWKDNSSDEISAMANEDKCILDKLKELKGGFND